MSTSADSHDSRKKKMIVLNSSDGESFEVEEAVAVESQTIKHMIEDGCAAATDGIPLPNVSGTVLAKILEYCNGRFNISSSSEPPHEEKLKKALKSFDSEFVKGMGHKTLLELAEAANYLDLQSLLGLTSVTLADMIKDAKVEKVREIFGVFE
ncbi:OLC1v1031944C1 [Oldenlandia corymbosa var. corymbosa]|uniref:SKP1-like protein n=1 Tax=Oldenlandia corymbosa var. corymbosa TaxID=529605 RepID=A0AAV1CMX5_OLDCO|nr:OLC1v1031944C1 [Oldenlandia corymbosa var. corymbosa]